MRFLWRFLRRRFFLLCVAIFLRLRFWPEPIVPPWSVHSLNGEASVSSRRDGLGCLDRSGHLGLQLLARLEHGDELGRHQDLGAAARVAGAPGAALAHFEGSKSPDLEVFPLTERPTHGIDQP